MTMRNIALDDAAEVDGGEDAWEEPELFPLDANRDGGVSPPLAEEVRACPGFDPGRVEIPTDAVTPSTPRIKSGAGFSPSPREEQAAVAWNATELVNDLEVADLLTDPAPGHAAAPAIPTEILEPRVTNAPIAALVAGPPTARDRSFQGREAAIPGAPAANSLSTPEIPTDIPVLSARAPAPEPKTMQNSPAARLSPLRAGGKNPGWIVRARALAPRALRVCGYSAGIWLSCVVLLILAYRFVNPISSNLMIFEWLGGARIDRTWVPLERISPQLARAVIASEDARFCSHMGLDLEEIRAAISRTRDGVPRGASTLSMQLVKNLFLWPGKSYLRKLIEAPLTLLVEIVWPKWRIFEIYANVAEWGPGVFGAEAAARHHFGKSAVNLSAEQAALLAAALPNPVLRNAGRPGPGMRRLARTVQMRMRAGGGAAACVERRMTP